MPEAASLLDAAICGDHRTVRQACSRALSEGFDLADLIVEVLAPVQREVGERWLTGAATVADEHRASAALDSVLAGFELVLPPSTGAAPVICVCAEGDWHAIATRMMALVVASAGWPVVFLGPSLPAADLGAVASDIGAVAVAISTGSVAALPGTARCVRAVLGAGRPVVVGGHAFAAVPAAADVLGVPVFADPRQATSMLGDLDPASGPVELDDQGVLALELVGPQVVVLAAEVLRPSLPSPSRTVLREAAGHLVGFARTAILLGDRSVVSSHLGWVETFARSRGLDLTGSELCDAVGEAGDFLLEDSSALRLVLDG